MRRRVRSTPSAARAGGRGRCALAALLTALATAPALWACAAGPELRIQESEAFAADRASGVLRVTAAEARLEGDGRRVLLIQAPPQTAESLESLLARTASALRRLDGRRVQVRGELQGDVLWSAEIEDPGTY